MALMGNYQTRLQPVAGQLDQMCQVLTIVITVCQNQRSTSSTARTSKSTPKRPAAQAARSLNRSAASNGTNLNPRNGAKVPARTCSVWRLSREVRVRCSTSSFHSAAKRSPKIWTLCTTNPPTACSTYCAHALFRAKV
uniref:(northern house mosquito) hypothetical protein n=1 Tax=Culex pipiens TaxID=7175 RepID=A0A8D8IZ23_CULPI